MRKQNLYIGLSLLLILGFLAVSWSSITDLLLSPQEIDQIQFEIPKDQLVNPYGKSIFLGKSDSDEFENSLKDSQIKIAAFIKVKLFVAMQIHQLCANP